MQRIADVATVLVVIERNRLLHDGLRVLCRVIAERHRDMRQILRGSAEPRYVPPPHHRMAGAGRGEAPRRPETCAAAIFHRVRPAIIAVDERDRRCLTRCNRLCRHHQRDGGEAPMRFCRLQIRGVEVGNFGKAVVRQSVEDHAVNVIEADPRIRHCSIQRRYAEPHRIGFREHAIPRVADPDDAGLVPEIPVRHAFTPKMPGAAARHAGDVFFNEQLVPNDRSRPFLSNY
ncbi:hypothetical protein D9M73_137550 [compost metagenome]